MEGKRYLLFESTPSQFFSNYEDRDDEWQQFEKMAEQYHIEAFVKETTNGSTEQKIPNYIGRRRVDNYLQGIAEKYQLTNSEYLRLRQISLATLQANKADDIQTIDTESIAEEIVKNREN